MNFISLLLIPLLAAYSADLAVFEGDIRQVDVPSGVAVHHIETDWFIASGEIASLDLSRSLIPLEGAEIDELRLVHLRTPGDQVSASAVGRVLYCRGSIALVRVQELQLRAYEGVNLVQPLPVYPESSLQPFLPSAVSDPAIADIAAAVDQDSLIATIQHYQDYETRLCITEQFHNSCLWTRDRLQDYDLSAAVDSFNFTFYGEDYTSWNVVGEQPGLIEPDVVVIICGHLDSITMSNPYETAPGADDNGSGSATVLEAARILSDYNFRYTIRYLCFGAEELGLFGSEYYAQQASAAGDSILGVVNLDMILFAPDSLRQLFVPYNTISEDLAMTMETVTGIYVPELELDVQYSPGTTYSDHASFWAEGYPAVLGIEKGVNQNPWYHQETDLLANYLEFFPFGTECAKAAIATVAVIADPLEEGIGSQENGTGLILSAGPMPVSSALTVMISPGAQGELSVLDMAGRVVLSKSASGGETTLDLSTLPQGVYSLRATSGEESESLLFVVAR